MFPPFRGNVKDGLNMNYIITESRLDKLIFNYLDGKNFIQLEREYSLFDDTSIFFVSNESDEYATIRYENKTRYLFISIRLSENISSLFNLSQKESEMIISKWVEKTLNTKIRDVDSWPHDTFMFKVILN